MFEFGEDQITALLAGIFSGAITPYDLPEPLYYAISDYLKKGLYKGFGGSLLDYASGSTDYELLAELRENIYIFSGAKTYQQIKDMSDLLTQGDGIATLKQFNEGARQIFDQYNRVWGETEYNTAIGQGQCAVKWNNIQAEKDILPLLKYSAVGGENTCPICGALDGLIRPVDDPIWRTKSPLNHFNCLCLLLQLREGEITSNERTNQLNQEVDGKMQDIFKMNPGIDKVVFSDDHPYFQVEKKDKGYAANNFNLPIPNTD